jgi:hypothetical protein
VFREVDISAEEKVLEEMVQRLEEVGQGGGEDFDEVRVSYAFQQRVGVEGLNYGVGGIFEGSNLLPS